MVSVFDSLRGMDPSIAYTILQASSVRLIKIIIRPNSFSRNKSSKDFPQTFCWHIYWSLIHAGRQILEWLQQFEAHRDTSYTLDMTELPQAEEQENRLHIKIQNAKLSDSRTLTKPRILLHAGLEAPQYSQLTSSDVFMTSYHPLTVQNAKRRNLFRRENVQSTGRLYPILPASSYIWTWQALVFQGYDKTMVIFSTASR